MANSKDVVVTGVSTGIGWGTTRVLVSKGFRVFGSVRKQADADRLQSEFGNGFVALMMDITDADAVHQAAQKVGSMIGDRNLVGLVNNAGIVVSSALLADGSDALPRNGKNVQVETKLPSRANFRLARHSLITNSFDPFRQRQLPTIT